MENIFLGINEMMAGHWFYIISVVSLVGLLFLMKNRRVNFVLPLILISVVILNPILSNIWIKYSGYAYWRMLWLFPVIPLCATLPSVIVEKIKEKKILVKLLVVLAFSLIFATTGTFIYTDYWGKFDVFAGNKSKIPEAAVEVSNYLISIDENPKAVIVPEIYYNEKEECYVVTGLQDYIRQFSGKIDLMFGRYEYIIFMNSEAYDVYNNLVNEDGDIGIVALNMLNEGYKYLVVNKDNTVVLNKVNTGNFELIHAIEGYNIYKVYGKPAKIKTRNEKGQVISIKTIDEEGNPIDGENGYSEICYEYDRSGNIVKEFRIDVNGEAVCDNNGYSGWEKSYDYKSRVVMERFLGEEGEPVFSKEGYYEVRRKYESSLFGKEKIVTDLYFDEENESIIISEGYAAITRYYDKNNLCVREIYLDERKNPIMTAYGYAEVIREYDEKFRCIGEYYYDEKGNPCEQLAGYYGKKKEYDEDNILRRIIYLDYENNEVERKDGYSEVIWINNQEKNTKDVIFLNRFGEEIEYEGLNLIKDMKCRGDGWSNWMTPKKDEVNCCFNVGTVNLGCKSEGDIYTCKVCIEFSDVTVNEGESFTFLSQGSADGKWNSSNVWDSSLVYLNSAPQDGVYNFVTTSRINSEMEHISEFNVGFRCDNWASGSFRIKDLIITKGDKEVEYFPGL